MPRVVYFIDDDILFLKLAKYQCKNYLACTSGIFYLHIAQDALETIIQKIDARTTDEYLEIFLDINMPGMTGFEFVDKLEQLRPGKLDFVNIYLLSSSIDPFDLSKAEQKPIIKKFLQKPLKSEYLQAVCV